MLQFQWARKVSCSTSHFSRVTRGMWFAILQARIKAINTFFAKNGYRVVDSSVYAQPIQTQAQFASPLFMQPVYSPQQYSIYSIVPQTWSPNPAPYFETPLVSNSCWVMRMGEIAQRISNGLEIRSVGLAGSAAAECGGFQSDGSVLYQGPHKARLWERQWISPLSAVVRFRCAVLLSSSWC